METDEWIVIGAMIFVVLVGVFFILYFRGRKGKSGLSRFPTLEKLRPKIYLILLVLFLILGGLGVIFYGLYENKEPIWWIIPTGVIGFLVIFLVLYLANKIRKRRRDFSSERNTKAAFESEPASDYESDSELGSAESPWKRCLCLLHHSDSHQNTLSPSP